MIKAISLTLLFALTGCATAPPQRSQICPACQAVVRELAECRYEVVQAMIMNPYAVCRALPTFAP